MFTALIHHAINVAKQQLFGFKESGMQNLID